MSDQKSPSEAYAEWLKTEAKEAPPFDEDAVDPDEDDAPDIDDEEDDTEVESDSESTDSAPSGASTAQAQADATSPPDDGQKEIPMNKAEIKSGLAKLAADENAPDEDRNAAKRALAAMDDEPDGDEPKSEDEPAPEPDVDESDEDEPKDKPPEACNKPKGTDDQDEDDKPNAASALALAAEVQALSAWKSKTEKREERTRLMASRPDFIEATVKWLNGQKIDVVRAACQSPSKGGLPLGNGKGGQISAALAAAANAGVPTAGANQPQGAPGTTSTGRTNYSGDGERMDQLMGLTRTLPVVESQNDGTGTVVVMRATKRADAVRQLAARNGVK